MRGPSDQHVRSDDLPGHGQRQVILAQVQDVGARGPGDIGAVVDREQRAVTCGGLAQNRQILEFLGGLQPAELPLTRRSLVAQLHDVHPARQGSVHELGEITALPASVGAEVQVSGLKPGRTRVHSRRR
ncbi:Uncharacterised protein [Mycobacteroides abscessus subsp. abscessus]|nr:Uncharacterised protein [Mycobacteroides abscessus subsp. abscessus]